MSRASGRGNFPASRPVARRFAQRKFGSDSRARAASTAVMASDSARGLAAFGAFGVFSAAYVYAMARAERARDDRERVLVLVSGDGFTSASLDAPSAPATFVGCALVRGVKMYIDPKLKGCREYVDPKDGSQRVNPALVCSGASVDRRSILVVAVRIPRRFFAGSPPPPRPRRPRRPRRSSPTSPRFVSSPLPSISPGDDLDANVYECYAVEPSAVLRALREETSALRGARMQVAPEQGALLALAVEMIGARRVVEIGTYTGYSSIAMALAMRGEGALYACDKSEEALATARRYWARAGVEGIVKEKFGDAKESVRELLDAHGAGSFDLGFIDADKRAYREYYEALLELVRPGGLIIVDNVLWYGKVADAEVNDKQTEAIRAFNEFVAGDERVSYSMIPVGDGLSFCRKR